MEALAPNFLEILKSKLTKDFVPYLPDLLRKNAPKDQQDKKQLSRAFSAFVFHKMLDINIVKATKSVVDDFDDNGIDAIYYSKEKSTLYILQTKLEANKQFDQSDALKFRNGVELLLSQSYDKFNANVQNRIAELNTVFIEAEVIQLVVAYVGPGLTVNAESVLKELTENKEHYEAMRLENNIKQYGPVEVRSDLLKEQSLGEVSATLILSKWQYIEVPRETHIGVISVTDLVKLYQKHEKALYEKNIRYFLGSSGLDVNKSIQNTLSSSPVDFFYLNNGITILADFIDTPKGLKHNKRLSLRNFSVINGAQTISSAAEFVEKHSTCDISEAKVLITIIKSDADGKFGRSVTRARNHQNPVSTENFLSLDMRQEDLRRELAYLGYSYHYRPEATPRSAEKNPLIITIEESIKALALFAFDPRYAFWLKSDLARFQNAESNEYQALFKKELTGTQLVNKVIFFRFIFDVLISNSKATGGAEGLFYRHGVFVIAAVLGKKIKNRMEANNLLEPAQFNKLLSTHVDSCRQICWEVAEPMVGQGRSVLAFFQNQGNTVRLLHVCMAKYYELTKEEAYIKVKSTADKNEDYPQQKLFKYLVTQATQI